MGIFKILGSCVGSLERNLKVFFKVILYNCCGETASGRSREARARQIAHAGKPQAQDARATKKARPETKSKKTVESNYG